MIDLYTLNDWIEGTVRLRAAVEWLKRAKEVKAIKLPFSIEGLDDPIWQDFKEQETARLERIEKAKDEIEAAAKALRDMEAYLTIFLPFGVWILHEYRDRLFGVGVAYDHTRRFPKRVIRVEMIESEDDLRAQPDLRWLRRSLSLVSEWEQTARATLRS